MNRKAATSAAERDIRAELQYMRHSILQNKSGKPSFTSGIEVDEEKIRVQARKDGTLSLREAGLEKVRLGLSSIEEVLSSTSED